MAKKKNILDSIGDWTLEHLAGPLGTFASFRPVIVIKDGLVAVMPVILVGSMFLLLALLGQPVIGNSGDPLLPFLAPFVDKIGLVNSLTMGFMSFYAAIAFSIVYAKHYDVDELTMAILGVTSFILMNINIVKDGQISVGNFGALGMFVSMLTVFLVGFIYRFCINKNLVIKMPDGVPPGVGNAFSALIPFAISFIVCWVLRTILNIDIAAIFSDVLQPIFKAADNIFLFTFRVFIALLFWSVGVHGDNILGGIVDPIKLIWIGENATAAQNGVALTQLPHIWTTGLERCIMYVAALWGLAFWLYFSKHKATKVLAIASTPSTIFGIIEPVVFGLPVILNPILMIPWVVSGTLAAFVGYGIMSLGFINRFFIELPWATPAPIIAVVGTGGDWKALIIVIQAFLIGVICYYPFFKALEKQQDEEEIEVLSEEGK